MSAKREQGAPGWPREDPARDLFYLRCVWLAGQTQTLPSTLWHVQPKSLSRHGTASLLSFTSRLALESESTSRRKDREHNPALWAAWQRPLKFCGRKTLHVNHILSHGRGMVIGGLGG